MNQTSSSNSAVLTATRSRSFVPIRKAVRSQREIAQLAGVSLGTVYNALHRRERVAKETLQRIDSSMEEYDYQPDEVARSMVRGRTQVLGVVLPTLEIPYYAKLFSSIECHANELGYHCIASQHLDKPSKEESEVTALRRRRVDGLIIRGCGQAPDAEFFKRLSQAGTPFVLIDRLIPGLERHLVMGDDQTDAANLVTYLIGKGHRRIAYIGLHSSDDFHRSPRYLGYADALTAHGLAVDENLCEPAEAEYSSGFAETNRIFERTRENSPTAIFAFNDHTAMSVIAALRKLGRRVPEDVAVVGFGGYMEQGWYPVRPTTVAQNTAEIGRKACDILIDLLNNGGLPQGPFLVRGQVLLGETA